MTRSDTNLVWMDLEMTGLDPESYFILEVGVLVTTADLEPLSEGLCLPIAQPEAVLRSMDPWCLRQHTKSGLVERVRQSGVPIQEADERLLRLVRRFCYKNKSPLCGNSVCQDRRFLIKYMPRVEGHLHYRHIDVSSLKELVHRWYPREFQFSEKKHAHLALDDIHESIAELRYYREHFFAPPSGF